ncbi:MAG: sigma-70 family RNA polymerase sigma factor [Thiobacillaceae bacterium]
MTDEGQLNAREARLKDLLLRGLDGEAPAYQAFLEELSTHLRAYFRKRLAHLQDEVEDLVQESLLAIHNKRQTYDADQPLTAWVHAIAKYKLIDLLRRRASRDVLTDPLNDEMDFLSSADSEAAEAKRDLGKLLAQLPDRQRLPIVHTKLEGLSVTEAAQITGMSESAVKVGVHRGMKALAALIRGKS